MKPNALVLAAAAAALLGALAGCNEASRQEGASTSRAPQSSQAQREGTAPGPMAANPTEPAAPGSTPQPDTQAPGAAPGASPGAAPGAAPGTETPGASTGAKVDDAAVTAKVKAALISEAGLAAARVNVTTNDGKVTLKGAVPKDQIERIVQAARSVDGVQDVDNQLRPVAG